MANSPITPNAPNVTGHVVSIWTAGTGGAGAEATFTLPDYAPKINIDIAHPVLSVGAIDVAVITNSHYGRPEDEMARDVAADTNAAAGAAEWRVSTISAIIMHTAAAEAYFVDITYIAFGVQKA